MIASKRSALSFLARINCRRDWQLTCKVKVSSWFTPGTSI